MNLNEAMRQCATDLLETEDMIGIEQLVDCTVARYPDILSDEAERLIYAAARRTAKSVLSSMSDDNGDGGQLTFPGLKLPTALAIPAENEAGYLYIRADKATWVQLEAARHLRVLNIERAQVKLDEIDDAMNQLRPFMIEDPTMTVADAAVQMLGGDE